MIVEEDNYLMHYGILRRSGRYPWGSGGNVEERSRSFLDYVKEMLGLGMSETEIARGLSSDEHPFTTTDLRALKSIARNQIKAADIAMAQRLKDKAMSNVAIGERMGINESSVRALLAPGAKDKADVLSATSAMLREQVDKKGYIDISGGVEQHLGISETKLRTAVAMLKAEGYEVHNVQVDQLGTNNKTLIKVLAPEGTTYRDIVTDKGAISQLDAVSKIDVHSEDGGRTFFGMKPPTSVKSSRIDVKYGDEGGSEADGVIYIRPGVKDLDLGGSRYAQVRIAVDGTHYLKGMAMYKDDLPSGVDLQFNTNKKRTGNKLDAMKPLKDDPDNPFGAVIDRQNDAKTLNILNEEGGWETWSKSLSTQVLSKQSPTLAKTQLDVTYERKKSDLDEIMSLSNPAVRKKLLDSYADSTDSSAVHLKAAAMPRQASHVILPVRSLKETEIYAPNYRNGERVSLIRYPHGGTFEIPELTVNNRHPESKSLLGNAKDAVGINHKVAERLSGADFDGDTVLVIPNNSGKLKSTPALAGLKGFDPQSSYPKYEGMKTIDGGVVRNGKVDYGGKSPSPRGKGMEMGLVSNLITDMTIKGASTSEIARAVRHSMVVIDAEKHGLNYKQSALDNGIPQLMKKYQDRSQGGSSTLISRATSPTNVRARKTTFDVDKATGKKIYRETGESYTNGAGKTVFKTQRSTKLAEASNAHSLVSKDGGTKIESVYADHSNRLKALANEARKASVHTESTPYSPSAKATYHNEVASLNSKLNLALRNRPLERQAQILANTVVKAKRDANPEMDHTELKKIKAQALAEARNRTGAKKQQVHITEAEWNAIQAGAISNNKLTSILNNADLDQVKKLATPKSHLMMTSSKISLAKAMAAAGYTQAEIADHLGVSLTTLKTTIK